MHVSLLLLLHILNCLPTLLITIGVLEYFSVCITEIHTCQKKKIRVLLNPMPAFLTLKLSGRSEQSACSNTGQNYCCCSPPPLLFLPGVGRGLPRVFGRGPGIFLVKKKLGNALNFCGKTKRGGGGAAAVILPRV